MTSIKIYGKKGVIVCKPFQVNTADDEPEAMTSEETQIFNYVAEEENNDNSEDQP